MYIKGCRMSMQTLPSPDSMSSHVSNVILAHCWDNNLLYTDYQSGTTSNVCLPWLSLCAGYLI